MQGMGPDFPSSSQFGTKLRLVFSAAGLWLNAAASGLQLLLACLNWGL